MIRGICGKWVSTLFFGDTWVFDEDEVDESRGGEEVDV